MRCASCDQCGTVFHALCYMGCYALKVATPNKDRHHAYPWRNIIYHLFQTQLVNLRFHYIGLYIYISFSFDFQMTLAMTTAFMIAWTPYTILAFYYILADYKDVPMALTVLAPYFSKSSTLYNPIVYFLAVKRFRKDLKSLLCGIFGLRKKCHARHKRVGQIDTYSSCDDDNSMKRSPHVRDKAPDTELVEIEMAYQNSRTILGDITESNVSLLAPEIPGNESNNNNNVQVSDGRNGNAVGQVANGIFTMSGQ